MPAPADAIVLLLDAGASTVAWARDVLPPAEVDAALGRGLGAAASGGGGGDGGGGGGGGGDVGADGAGEAAPPAAPPPNPRVFDVLRATAMRLVATRFCYFSKQDRMGLVVMGQPVDSNDEDDDEEGPSGSDDEEEEPNGDTGAGRGGDKGGSDGEEVAEEDSASLVHPVTKVTFDLMRKLRELPISGAETVFRDGIVRAGGHMMVMTANTKLTRRILLFTDARTGCSDEDQDLLIDAVGAMHAEGMRLDVVIPGLAQLPEYDGDEEAWEAAAGEDDGSNGGSAAGPSPPAGGGRKPRKQPRGAPADDDGGMDVELAAGGGADKGSQENEEEEEEEEGAVRDPVLAHAFAPDDVDAEVRARLEHSAAAGGGVRKTKAQARNETLLRRAAAVTGGMPLSIAALTDYLCEPRKRSVRPVAKYAGTLSLSPAVHIPVRAYTATTEVRQPTCKRLSWARTLEAGRHVVATRQTTFATLGKPDENLDEEDIMPAYAYGSDIVPVSAEVDATLVRCPSGPKSLRVLGFVPLTAIPQVYFLSAVDAVMAMGEVPESRTGLAALATAMRRTKRGAIARLVMRDDAAAQLKFLWADELPAGDASDGDDDEEDDGEGGEEAALGRADRQPRPFLYMASMPLADGIRAYAFPSMQPKLDVLTTQKRDAVDALFDAFDMDAPSTTGGGASAMRDDSDDDEGVAAPGSQNSDATAGADGEDGRALDCEAIFNPAIHLFFAATVQRALDGITGTALPPLPPALGAPLTPAAHVRDAAAAADAVGRFAELLPTRRVDPRSVRKEREYFAANRDGSKQLLGAFLPDEFGDADDDSVPPAGVDAAADPPPASAAAATAERPAEAAAAAAAPAPVAGDPPAADVPPPADGPVLPPAVAPAPAPPPPRGKGGRRGGGGVRNYRGAAGGPPRRPPRRRCRGGRAHRRRAHQRRRRHAAAAGRLGRGGGRRRRAVRRRRGRL